MPKPTTEHLQRIADLLMEHCGIDLGNEEHDDPEKFATLVEAGCKNHGTARRELRAKQRKKAALQQQALRMSIRGTRTNQTLTHEDRVAQAFAFYTRVKR